MNTKTPTGEQVIQRFSLHVIFIYLKMYLHTKPSRCTG